MDDINAITLFYLLSNKDVALDRNNPVEFVKVFRETKETISIAMREANGLSEAIGSGDFTL